MLGVVKLSVIRMRVTFLLTCLVVLKLSVIILSHIFAYMLGVVKLSVIILSHIFTYMLGCTQAECHYIESHIFAYMLGVVKLCVIILRVIFVLKCWM
jgi:hypothetical protein